MYTVYFRFVTSLVSISWQNTVYIETRPHYKILCESHMILIFRLVSLAFVHEILIFSRVLEVYGGVGSP